METSSEAYFVCIFFLVARKNQGRRFQRGRLKSKNYKDFRIYVLLNCKAGNVTRLENKSKDETVLLFRLSLKI